MVGRLRTVLLASSVLLSLRPAHAQDLTVGVAAGPQSLAAPLAPALDVRVFASTTVYPRLGAGLSLSDAVHLAADGGGWVELTTLMARGEWRLDEARLVPQLALEGGLVWRSRDQEVVPAIAYGLDLSAAWRPDPASGFSLGLGVRYLGVLGEGFPSATTWSLRVGYTFDLR